MLTFVILFGGLLIDLFRTKTVSSSREIPLIEVTFLK